MNINDLLNSTPLAHEPKVIDYFVTDEIENAIILYRFEGYVYVYDNGEVESTIYLKKFHVARETLHCYVIEIPGTKPKFILKAPGNRRYAYRSKNEAWKSYQKRLYNRDFFAHREVEKVERLTEDMKFFGMDKDWEKSE